MSANPRRRLSVVRPGTNADEAYESPRPHLDRFWTDKSGVTWRRRGQGLLTPARARRLLREPDTIVIHVYTGPAHEHVGKDRDDLVHQIEEFWAGRAHPMADFFLAEFRDPDRRVMVMVVEHC